ncbi:MAG: RNA methyltransferase [Acidobacteriota bacterium]
MKLPYEFDASDRIGRKRFSVILVRPENQENIGLVARAMRNTGFEDLRLVGLDHLEQGAFRTAIHSKEILEHARFYPNLGDATASLNLVAASTARRRTNFFILTLSDAVESVLRHPTTAQVGLLFGNERTGLTSEELGSANIVFHIPQATRQPSYNLASAVLLTLFSFFGRSCDSCVSATHPLLSRIEQDECIRLLVKKLEAKRFIHGTNRAHVVESVQDLFGRIALTERDRGLLLSLFGKVVE